MKRLLPIVFMLVSFTTLARELHEYNGIDWQRMTEVEKVAWVRGYIAGTRTCLASMMADVRSTQNERYVLAQHFLWFVEVDQAMVKIENWYREHGTDAMIHMVLYLINDIEYNEVTE